MHADLKKILKSVVLEMRHELEGYYDNAGKWHPGDLETRLAEIGVRKDRASVPVDELGRLIDEDVRARKIVDAFIAVREQAGVDRAEAVAEYIRESAYTWANRLVALRCMEARELLDDEVIVGREAYGGRSLVHHRLAQSSPELCTGEDDGRFAMLAQVFAERAKTLPMLFDPDSPSIALRPSPAALKNCLAWLSGTQKVRSQEPATDAVFAAPDALGWAYQYWNTEEKDRVFEMVRTKKGAKIEGADIIPATQLYTEGYMVKFLVQNSLGATWMGMHPESQLFKGWEYYVRDADRAPAKKKPLQQITLLDPACGSGHFLIEAFDMLYAMYEEEGSLKNPEAICRSILENNLFGIDIDERAIQIAEASLWMKAEEKSFGFSGANTNLVAATSSHLKGESWERYLAKLQKEPSTVRVLRKFAVEMKHIDELGSLARPAEALESIVNEEHEIWENQERERREADKSLFKEIRDDLIASQLPFQDISDKEFFERTMRHALFAIDGFTAEAREEGEFNDQLMGAEARTGFRLLDLLSRKYNVVVANPPYMGSRNQSAILRNHLGLEFSLAKSDVYAAFILRCNELAECNGRVAMIAQQSWMFVGSFAKMRCGTESQPGINATKTIEVISHLGRYAFSEIGNAAVAPLMFVMSNTVPQDGHSVWASRLALPRLSDEQARLLMESTSKGDNTHVYRKLQARFSEIPSSPICYWLSDRLLDLFVTGKPVGSIADCIVACKTSKNSRFVRCWWESPDGSTRWKSYEKDAVGFRFGAIPQFVIDWSSGAVTYYRNHYSAQLPNRDYWFRTCVVTSKISGPQSTARILDSRALADMAVNQVFPRDTCVDIHALCALLNSSLAVFYLRILNPTLNSQPTDVARVPVCHLLDDSELSSTLSNVSKEGARVVSELSELYVTHKDFVLSNVGSSVNEVAKLVTERRRDLVSELGSLRNRIDSAIKSFLDLREDEAACLNESTSTDDVEIEEDIDSSSEDSIDLDCDPDFTPEVDLSTCLGEVVESRVLQVLGFTWGGTPEGDSITSEKSDEDGIVPLTEIIKESTLKERINTRFREDKVGVSNFAETMGKSLDEWLATEFFGHHVKQFKKRPIAWQLQSSSFTARKLPAFACLIYYHRIDVDAIAKIRTQYTGPLKLRFETEVRGILSTPVASRTDNHARRAVELEEAIRELQAFDEKLAFIARSGFGPARLLPTLRQYAFDDAMLSMKACYLQRLSVLLKQSHDEEASNGICSPSRLNDWQDQAINTELHQDLAAWIGEALSHLSYFCSQVGPKAPDAMQTTEDPIAADFGSLIQADIASMQTGSMKLACGVWWGKFDAAVLAPIRDRIKILKAEQKELNAAIKEDRQPMLVAEQIREESSEYDSSEIESAVADMPLLGNHVFEPTIELTKAAMKARLKEVKAKIKKFTEEMDSKAGKAQAIRDAIQAWQLPDPIPASLDFSPSSPNLPPLFDQVSSLDERRSPPKTIAEFITQESLYAPDINDGVRVNIAPLQKAGILAADVLAAKDVDKAIADRAEWRADERRWVREGKLPQPGWWKVSKEDEPRNALNE